MSKCEPCGAPLRVPGEHYDSRQADTVKNLNGLIKVAEPCESLPPTIFFMRTTPPKKEEDGSVAINIEIESYVDLSRIPEPLRTLVKDLLDVKA